MNYEANENKKNFVYSDVTEGIKLPTLKLWSKSTAIGYSCTNLNFIGMITEPFRFYGVFVDSGNEKFGIIPGNEFSPYIFRGQNKDYPSFCPSEYRLTLNNNDVRLKHCIEWILKKHFLETFKTTPYYERCRKFRVLNCNYDFNLEAIAQHYNFMSKYLDVTRELNVALFFAYTYYDAETDSYHPISDFNLYTPTLYIANISQYTDSTLEKLKPISFQALLRPFKQQALAINMEELNENELQFEKYKLPQNQAISSEIYLKAQRGLAYFPEEPIGLLANILKSEKKLHTQYFNEYCTKYSVDKEVYKSKLLELGYSFTTEAYYFDNKTINFINDEIDNGIIPYLKNDCGIRGYSDMKRY